MQKHWKKKCMESVGKVEIKVLFQPMFSKLVVGKWAPQIKVNEGECGDEGWVTDS